MDKHEMIAANAAARLADQEVPYPDIDEGGGPVETEEERLAREAAAGGSGGGGGEGDYKPKFGSAWDVLKESLSTEENPFDLPEPVKTGKFGEGESEFDYLVSTIVQSIDPTTIFPAIADPFIVDYMKEKSEKGDKFNVDEFVSSRSNTVDLMKLSGKAFITKYFTEFELKSDQNPDGYTEEDINDYVGKLNNIEANQLANQIKENRLKPILAERARKANEINSQKEQEEFNTIEERNKGIVGAFVEKTKSAKEIFGIELGEAEKTAILNELPKLFSRDPKTKKAKIDTMLQDGDTIFEVAFLLSLGKEKIKSIFTNYRNSARDDVHRTLGIDGYRPRPGSPPANSVIDNAALAE